MKEIRHFPHTDVSKVIEHYTKKDGVDIKYVCTSALGSEEFSMDIFYRETPHPEFGNRYFGLFASPITGLLTITNADRIEEAEFAVVTDDNGDLQYSAHRHDYKSFKNGNAIDGGRAYIRGTSPTMQVLRIVDGEFAPTNIETFVGC